MKRVITGACNIKVTQAIWSSVLLLAPLFVYTSAEAGSFNGSLEQSSTVSCDFRHNLQTDFHSWCSYSNAKLIKSSCYAVIHSDPIQRCGWQGCGFISFVGQKPTVSGSNVREYGISTPHGLTSVPESWQPAGGAVLPKAPFPRVYLTVEEFVTVKENCSKDHSFIDPTSADRICSAEEKTLELNPYYFCMKYHRLVP